MNAWLRSILLASVGLTLAGSASADICTAGSKNFKIKVSWSGGSTEERPACMFSCTVKDVSFKHTDCYKSASNSTGWRYTCDISVRGLDRKPGQTTWMWSFSQKYNKVELPWNKLPDAIVAEASLGCRD